MVTPNQIVYTVNHEYYHSLLAEDPGADAGAGDT